MSNIIEHPGDGNDDAVVVIGSEGAPVSMKLYQDIYHQITGRSEKVSQKYSENLLLEFSEIEQLHHKIMQICDIHEVIAKNELVTIFHEKERKEQFTSFDRFKFYNSNATQHTVSVVIKYNFSIMISGLKKPQEYVVTVVLNSKVAMIHSFESEVPAFMRGKIFNIVGFHPAEISVEYADFIVARSFLQAFQEWIDGCGCEENNKFLDKLRNFSHTFPVVFKLSIAMCFSYFSINALSDSSLVLNTNELFRLIVLYGASFYFVIVLSGVIGKVAEGIVDNIYVLSYLKINKGDSKLIEKFSSRNRKTWVKSIFTGGLTVLLGILSSKISEFI